ISTNLLTERLKGLEEQGVTIRRTLPPPAASTVYELTARGRALEPALLEFGKWGSQFVGEAGTECRMLHLGSYALTPQTFFRPTLAQGLDKTYGLYIGGEMQTVRIVDGTIDVWQGEPSKPDMAIYAEVPIYLSLLTRQIDPHVALADGLVRVEGDQAELFRYLDLCGMPTDDPAITNAPK
ncbi:MAG: helix-turn-helix transcriptional regulator, partial [Caldilineaceae bacterium]|nr:helix-turn-helix transcriptional regulator [Caldilineaceae bacterium]